MSILTEAKNEALEHTFKTTEDLHWNTTVDGTTCFLARFI